MMRYLRNMITTLATASTALLLAGSVDVAQGECTKLLADNAGGYHEFGYSVDIGGYGSWAVIGEHFDNPNGIQSGSAYIFTNEADGRTWLQDGGRLVPRDGNIGHEFGTAVAISLEPFQGFSAVVGARYALNDIGQATGAVYVFRNYMAAPGGNWVEEAKLLPVDGAPWDEFGRAVAITNDGNIAVVGAPAHDHPYLDCGAAYVFRRSDRGTPSEPSDDYWLQDQELLASTPQAEEYFGRSVAISPYGDIIVVGAYRRDENGTNAGAAFVYRYDSASDDWVEEQKLLGLSAGDEFGRSVATDGGTIVIGAPQRDLAQVFKYSSNLGYWFYAVGLVASDGQAGDRFGYSVDIFTPTIVVGAPYRDDEGNRASGAAYVFQPAGTGYEQKAKLQSPDAGVETRWDNFGWSVAVYDSGLIETTVIGAPGDDNSNGDNAGAACVFFEECELRAVSPAGADPGGPASRGEAEPTP